jgi:hypothetical protein
MGLRAPSTGSPVPSSSIRRAPDLRSCPRYLYRQRQYRPRRIPDYLIVTSYLCISSVARRTAADRTINVAPHISSLAGSVARTGDTAHDSSAVLTWPYAAIAVPRSSNSTRTIDAFIFLIRFQPLALGFVLSCANLTLSYGCAKRRPHRTRRTRPARNAHRSACKTVYS